MTEEKINFVVNKFHDKISETQTEELRARLENIPDEKCGEVASVKLKDPYNVCLLSFILGLFGAGSFYLGQIWRGIVKVIFNVIVPLALGLIFLFWLAPYYRTCSEQSYNVYDTLSAINYGLKTPQVEYKTDYDKYKSLIEIVENQANNINTVYKYFNGEIIYYNGQIVEKDGDTDKNVDTIENNFKKFFEYVAKINSPDTLIKLQVAVEEAQEIVVSDKEQTDEVVGEGEEEENILDFAKKSIYELCKMAETLHNSALAENYIKYFIDTLPLLESSIQPIIVAETFETISAAIDVLPSSFDLNNIADEIEKADSDIYKIVDGVVYKIEQVKTRLNELNDKAVEITDADKTSKEEDSDQTQDMYETEEQTKLEEFINEYLSFDIVWIDDFKNQNSTLLAGVNTLNETDIEIKEVFPKMLPIIDLITQTQISYATLAVFGTSYDLEESNYKLTEHKTLHGIFNLFGIEIYRYTADFYNTEIGEVNYLIYGTEVSNLVFCADIDNIKLFTALNAYFLFLEEPEQKVDAKVNLNKTLTNVLATLIDLTKETNINTVNRMMTEITDGIAALQSDTYDCYSEWHVSSQFIFMFIGTILTIDIVIILFYWIGEVFKDKEKCYVLNYEKILKILNG